MTTIFSKAMLKSEKGIIPDEKPLAGENVICFAGEDWWYHNPHSNLHLMQSFSKLNRVLFVNSIGVRMPSLAKDKYVWKKVLNKLASFARYLKQGQKNIWVLTPFALPILAKYEKAIYRINKVLLLAQLRIICRLLKFDRPVLWVCVPSVKDVALEMKKKAKCMVYYCVDNISFHSGEEDRHVLEAEKAIHESADLAFFVNHSLVEERKHINPRTYHLSHGVDYDHFARAHTNPVPCPADMAKIPGPVIGYIGVLRSLDFDLVKRLAAANPGFSFVFIGDIQEDYSEVMKTPNIYFLGKKPYAELPGYMSRMACYGIFYRMDDVFNNYRNPKKLLEYLATGKPIVSVPVLEMAHFGDLVYTARTFEEFDAFLKKAVERDTQEQKERRIRYAAEHTWDAAAKRAGHKINESIQRKAKGASLEAQGH